VLYFVSVSSTLFALPFVIVALHAQSSPHDPGVRPGAAGAGGPLHSVSTDTVLLNYFEDGLARFNEIDSVSGTLHGEPGTGLGPRFNSNSCGSCHAQPAAGGSSPSPHSPQRPLPNPEVAVATLDGALNVVPYFIAADGPVREARFKFLLNPDGTLSSARDGGVHDLYTIEGRTDATNLTGATGRLQTCRIEPPDFERMRALNNLIFRVPTPVFGAGLIENIPDAAIIDNMNDQQAVKRTLGISGHPNTSGNDGTITRFGWKAQNKSLEVFTGEAYNVEMGVTNELFPSKRSSPPDSCVFNALPEDTTNYTETVSVKVVSDVVAFANFMRLLNQPAPVTSYPNATQASIAHGRSLFVNTVKCGLCHTPGLATTASAITPSLGSQTAHLLSDLLVHHMGSGLADDIVQGAAGPDEFRTAPLWGLGQRIFFLHDGRTSDLLQAVRAHASAGSEANGVIALFNALSDDDKQDLLNFLRSL
jgi:CxxC motif-containing protein (DUF1111 family)